MRLRYILSIANLRFVIQRVVKPMIQRKQQNLSGHGYGLCQEGAAHKAKKGSTWSSILSYYYRSTSSLMCPHVK